MNVNAAINAPSVERLEIVETSARLAAIEGPWMRLWHSTDALIFQSHGWISAWWSTVRNQKQIGLRIGLIWNGDKLVAVLPLAISRRKGLRFLEWAAVAYSDYGDIICTPECPNEALGRLWARISKAGGFDVAFINRLLPYATARRIFAPGKAVGTRLSSNHRREISSRIAGDWENGAAWLASRTKNAQNYRRKIKMLEKAGALRIRLIEPGEPMGPVLNRLAALKRKWLEENDRTSELFDEGTPVLAALVDVLARAGVLRLFVIEVDDLVLAISVNFVQRNTMMMWISAYDPDFARASPGMLLTFDYVQWSFDHRLDAVDMLCGDEAYKDRYSTHTVELETLVGARTMKGSLALLMDGVRQKFRERGNEASAPEGEAD